MLTQGTQSTRWRKSDERGQALALAAVSMVAVIAMGALAVDLGMAFAARAAAQRAADSAALAGASAFIDYNFATHEAAAVQAAEARAFEYAESNDVLARPIDRSQVTVWVIPESQKVRVRIAATDLPTWFARVLGVYSMDVAAMAAAVASDGGKSAQCVLPFSMNDLWHTPVQVDTNANRIPDAGEEWSFDPDRQPERDKYLTFNPNPEERSEEYNGWGDGTGLGSSWRNQTLECQHCGGGGIPPIVNDRGRRIWIKDAPQGVGGDEDAGGTDIMVGPGNFRIWEMPDPEQDCQGRPGARWVQENIAGCNACDVYVDEPYKTQTGNIASIKEGLQELVDTDPGAYWCEDTQSIKNSKYGDNAEELSPRVRIIPLWDPAQALQGKSTFEFNNFGKIFVEASGLNPPDFAIYVRFLGPVTGGSAGPSTGSLVKYLRLVE